MIPLASLKSASRLALLTAVVAVLNLSAPPSGSNAQQADDVKILDFGAESQFPNFVRFWATVESDREIQDIRVNFSVGSRATSQYNYLELSPGDSPGVTEGEFMNRIDTSDRYIPPGAKVTYWLEVFDADGSIHRSEDRQLILTDARWDNWETTTDGPVTVYYRVTETRAKSLAAAANQVLAKMQPVTGAEITQPITMTLYNNNADMIGATVASSQAGARELIIEGQAFAEEDVVIVLAGNSDIGTATHEITHILVARAAGGTAFVPLWINEGLAEYGNLEPTVSYTRYLEWAIDTHRLTPLRNLRTFPGDPNLTLVAYGQARSAVAYLVKTYGDAKMAELLKVLGSGRSIETAMPQVYGLTLDEFDNEWRDSIGAEPVPAVASETPVPSATPETTPTPAESMTPTPAADETTPVGANSTATPAASSSTGTCNALPGSATPLANIAGLGLLGMLGTWRLAKRRR